ncbi:hypothetical protein V2A60_006185 [Cordyceps javanica]|uniref:SCP-like extracellular protein n=1 Tax=Cordyceps javanica TaxID=43265 RepID=A0A545W3W7_9HYPO|nr:SCP-like extracellular protein [Cordyceps javanica]TQW08693.1 SCP-like extracellular protein [Cordyceps javanica]
MFANAIGNGAVLALAVLGTISAAPLEARDHDDFNNKMLEATNWYRSQHGANDVSWDHGLADYASNHARTCVRNHSGGPHGENIAFSTIWSSSAAWVNVFGRERAAFDFANGGPGQNTGHFTQLVWKDTNRMGCGWAQCRDWYHVVCEYQNPGNVGGDNNRHYRENVGRQIWGNIQDEFQG